MSEKFMAGFILFVMLAGLGMLIFSLVDLGIEKFLTIIGLGLISGAFGAFFWILISPRGKQ